MIRIDAVAPVASTTACKVCGALATLYGVADFNKNCEEARGKHLPLAGVPIYYHQCDSCGLVFTEAFDRWDKANYLEHIYNDRYADIDPDYVEIRPRENSKTIRELMRPAPGIRHLDYGGGNGTLSRLLRDVGVDSVTWDPMDPVAELPGGTFGLVSAFEVFEHTPEPRATLDEIVGFCDPATPVIFFSTFTIDRLPPRAMDFWYLAPRNGHITVHTESSLAALFATADLKVHHYGDGWHIAYRHLPPWVDLSMFDRFRRRHRMHQAVIACGLHRQGRLRSGLRSLLRA